MFSKFMISVVITIMLTPISLLGAKNIVILKNGRKIVGEVTKTKEGYEIKIKGGTIVISADDVLRVTSFTTLRDELNRKLDAVKSNDVKGYYKVAYWAYDNDLLIEAQKILTDTVLKLKPNYEDAKLLLKLIKIRLTETKEKSQTTTTQPGQTGKPSKKPKPRLLTKDDIYRIRLVELKPEDKVVIKYRNRLLERFIKLMKGRDEFADPNFEKTFRTWPRIKQVWYILKNTSRFNTSIRDDILIETDPSVMRVFRTRIWPIIASTYGSPSCYGGVKGKDGLKLINGPSSNDQIIYTNFYILHKYERNGLKFINRDDPDMSLILQYGLPKKIAKVTRPPYIKGNIFTGPNDPKYKLIRNWILSLHHPFLPPGYRINYPLPWQTTTMPVSPTTKPSTPIPASP